MEYSEVIVVGGGPAGSACAWELNRNGTQTLILDRSPFPRPKLCAGWITPTVLENLQIRKEDYPHSIVSFNRIIFHIHGIKFKVRTKQYSIRRIEFDDWLIKRANVPVKIHTAKDIRKQDTLYIIDDKYRCKYIVGAGGTHCPVYKTFFRHVLPRQKKALIHTMEEEFQTDYQDKACHLWFFEDNLPGYSWYVPKGNGYLNVGIGGKAIALRDKGKTIAQYWDGFTKKLDRLSLVKNRRFHPKGHNYYLRHASGGWRRDNAFIIGDAAGLATSDMGEGIAPAIESGLLSADAIINKKEYASTPITRHSFINLLFPWPHIFRSKNYIR